LKVSPNLQYAYSFIKTCSINMSHNTLVYSDANQPSAKLYFGYGSNLWIQQMHKRCPGSHFVGIGRLKGYKWIINDRGYANIVELPKGLSECAQNEVWGLIFYLLPHDEAQLDKNEGVPYAYTKETLRVDLWPSRLYDLVTKVDVEEKSVRKEVLVYISRQRTKEDRPKDEYVYRMNKGIDDAIVFGLPEQYVNEVMRKFIPGKQAVDGRTLAKAELQALDFKDEYESD
jgi:gamma-glutamylcyclotransferase